MSCPRCGKAYLRIEDGRPVCSCGHMGAFLKPTYTQIEAENKKLKEFVDAVGLLLSDFSEYGEHDGECQRWAKGLLRLMPK